MASLNTPMTEQYVLSCLLNDTSLLKKVKENYFLNDISKVLYTSLVNLQDNNVEITRGNIILEGTKYSSSLTPDIIDTIKDIPHDLSSFDHYLLELHKNYTKYKLKHETVQQLLLEVDDKETLDYEKISEYFNQGKQQLRLLTNRQGKLKTIMDSLDEFEESQEKRVQGTSNSSGSLALDKALGRGFDPGEIVVIAGRTSMGKSALCLRLVSGCINLRVPTIYLTLEMSQNSTLKRLISMRKNLPLDFWSFSDKEDPMGHLELQKKYIKEMKEELSNYPLFEWSDEPSMTIDDLGEVVRDFREKHNIPKERNINVFVDLLSQLKDFKKESNLASGTEKAMDYLNEVVKEENFSCIGVGQFNRATEGDKKISKPEDIDKMEPSLINIKNSSAYEDRARIVLSVFRKYYYYERYLPDLKDLEDDVMKVKVLKNSDGDPGRVVNYLVNLESFQFENYIPPPEEDEDEE